MKKILALISLLSASYACAQDTWENLWSLDVNATNYGFSYKPDTIVLNNSGTAIGTTTHTGTTYAKAELNYSELENGFVWGETILKLSGNIDFTASADTTGTVSQWIGFSLGDSSSNVWSGYPFIWLSGDGIIRISSENTGNVVYQSGRDTGLQISTAGNNFRFECTYDTAKIDPVENPDGNLMYVTLDFYAADDTSVDAKPIFSVSTYVGKDKNGEDLGLKDNDYTHLLVRFNGSSTDKIDGWFSDLNVQAMNVTAVPEPSTYAVIFGTLALGFILYRKRR